MAADRIFPDEYVPREQASSTHKKWEQANPNGDAPKWRAFRDKVLAYKKGDPAIGVPDMATPHGDALVAAGKLHMSVTDLGSVTPPPVDPEPPDFDFFVSTSGSDSNNGSQASPWRTIKKACDSVSANQGVVISVAAGTYVEQPFTVPSGVSIAGAGMGQTIIRCGVIDKLMSIVSTTQAQMISDLTLDGQTKTTGNYGLWSQGTNNLTVTRVESRGFKGPLNHSAGACNIRNATDLTVSHCVFTTSGGSGGGYCSGTFGLGGITRGTIHDNTVLAAQGYAFKAAGDTAGFFLTDVEFYNNTFTVTSSTCSTWNNLCFEIWGSNCTNVRLHHNTFNGVLSLSMNAGALPGSALRVRVDHNHFAISDGNFYGIELIESSCEIDHNYISGGWVPIGHFAGGKPTKNNVHHNVFDNNSNTITAAWHYQPDGGTLCTFNKNTVVMRKSTWRDGAFSFGGTGNTVTITSNIFKSTLNVGDKLGIGIPTPPATISGNNFHNITGRGTGQINADPQLPLTGGFPAAYVPPGGSPAVGVGAFADGAWSDIGPQ